MQEIDRRTFLAVLTVAVVAPLPIDAQPARKTARIGILGVVPRSVAEPYVQALRKGLQDQGWEERNIVIEWASTEGRDDRLSVVAAELVQQRVDVIIAPGDLAGRAAKQATTTIPIVLAPSSDPVATGLVASLARPGGTVTGFSLMATEAYAKRLEIVREIVPGIATVGFLRNPDFPLAESNWNEVRTAARTLGLVAHVFDVREAKDFELAFRGMTKAGAAAVVVRGDPLIFSHQALIAELALKNKVASVYEWKEYVHRGGLMAYGPSLLDIWRRAGTFIDKILKGTKPGDLPIEQPTKFELVINLKTAKTLGLTIPQSLLLRADQIIE